MRFIGSVLFFIVCVALMMLPIVGWYALIVIFRLQEKIQGVKYEDNANQY